MVRAVTFALIGTLWLVTTGLTFGQSPKSTIELPKASDKRATFSFDQLRAGICQYYWRIQALARPDAEPNPAIEVRTCLPDGTEFKAVWSLLRQSDVAKLVTVHFFDQE